MFLHNFWYVAAYASEVGDTPLARTILGEPVLLYRTEAGKAIALEDRCCHRNLPLSMGRREGDGMRCGYHGLKFDASGDCIEIPGQKEIPPNTRVRRYPLLERWNFVWLWMGDPNRRDDNLLPDWRCIDDPTLTTTMGNGARALPMKCHWELNNDNLLDLMHVVYVHPETLGGAGLDDNPISTERGLGSVRMMRWSPHVAPPPLLAKLAGFDGKDSDRWQATICELPSHCTIDAGFAAADTVGRDGDWDQGVRLRALITATPETETTSFMFYAQSRNFAVGNEAVSERFIKQIRAVFDQDIAVMEGQQRNNALLPDAPRIEIRCDVPVVAMHRLIEQAAARERREPITVTRVEPATPTAPQPVPMPAPAEVGPRAR
ncbi:MAG TPA: aromatic ring-hydroxylating dioxygenase subunit alpha [Stellaceae bacterium]|jgi:vanillate O-demethylase monooxygenase subunit|nr:aromatic ring-hydroxylating dioxygenase subunit alpha [Stellaceae bacterium]